MGEHAEGEAAPPPWSNNTASSKKKGHKKNKSKKKKVSKNAPKPGDPGYLSPTQLRNARKRRAKQEAKKKKQQEGGEDESEPNPNTAKRRKTGSSNASSSSSGVKTGAASGENDPSLKFLRNPAGAPTVQAARKYFAPLLDSPTKDKDKDMAKANSKIKSRFQVHVGPTAGWRTVAKLAVRPDPTDPNNKRVIIGLFQPNSHAIVSVPNCRAHHPSINAAVSCLTDICNRLGVAAFNDKSGEGYLRYVALAVQRNTGKVMMTLVWNSGPCDDKDTSDGKKMLDRLTTELMRVTNFADDDTQALNTKKKRRRGKKAREEMVEGTSGDTSKTADAPPPPPFQLHSLWVHYNSQWKHSNAIFDIASPATTSWRLICGPPHVEETLESIGAPHPVALRFPPNVFRQANLDAFAHIVAAVRRRIRRFAAEMNSHDDTSDGTKTTTLPSCVELYGGVGTIGLNLIDMVSSLTSSDENPNNVACFRDSVAASGWPEEMKSRARYVGKNATAMIEDAQGFLAKSDVLVVDPPRKGLDGPVLSALTGSGSTADQLPAPLLVVYVSCGFDAFQRDCDALLGCGRYELEHAEGHLLFPGSDAIETLAFFVRKV